MSREILWFYKFQQKDCRWIITFPRMILRGTFLTFVLYRQFCNGKKQDWGWLIYSKKVNKMLYFCCKLFNESDNSQLVFIGFSDWRDVLKRLKEHEAGRDQILCMKQWAELYLRLQKD